MLSHRGEKSVHLFTLGPDDEQRHVYVSKGSREEAWGDGRHESEGRQV